MRTDKNTKKDFSFLWPLLAGLLLGMLVMVFWQFNLKLRAQSLAIAQLEQAASTNAKTVNDIVSFINGAVAGPEGTNAPANVAEPVVE